MTAAYHAGILPCPCAAMHMAIMTSSIPPVDCAEDVARVGSSKWAHGACPLLQLMWRALFHHLPRITSAVRPTCRSWQTDRSGVAA